MISLVEERKFRLRILIGDVVIVPWPIHNLAIGAVRGDDLFRVTLKRINIERNTVVKNAEPAMDKRLIAKRRPCESGSWSNPETARYALAFGSQPHVQ